MIDNKRIAVTASLLTMFVAVTIISSIFVISQRQDGLLAKKTNGNKSSPGQASSNSSSSSPSSSTTSTSPSPTGGSGGSSSSSGTLTHCDQAGYPSCYGVGYSDGLNAPGTKCPSGHSRAYCNGYTAASLSSVSSPDVGKKNTINQKCFSIHRYCSSMGSSKSFAVRMSSQISLTAPEPPDLLVLQSAC